MFGSFGVPSFCYYRELFKGSFWVFFIGLYEAVLGAVTRCAVLVVWMAVSNQVGSLRSFIKC